MLDRLTELIERCKDNDRSAQKEIFELFAAKMMAVCIRYSSNREDAQDMLQEGFIKVFSKIGSFNGDSGLATWMTRIFINTSLSEYRKAHLKYKHEEFDGDKHDEPENESPDLDEPREPGEVMKAIQELPEIYRIIINLYAIDGLSHLQIANELGISVGTSKSRLSRGRQMLKDILNKK